MINDSLPSDNINLVISAWRFNYRTGHFGHIWPGEPNIGDMRTADQQGFTIQYFYSEDQVDQLRGILSKTEDNLVDWRDNYTAATKEIERLRVKPISSPDDNTKRLLRMADDLAAAVQLFRNTPSLGRHQKLRETVQYAALVNAWDNYKDEKDDYIRSMDYNREFGSPELPKSNKDDAIAIVEGRVVRRGDILYESGKEYVVVSRDRNLINEPMITGQDECGYFRSMPVSDWSWTPQPPTIHDPIRPYCTLDGVNVYSEFQMKILKLQYHELLSAFALVKKTLEMINDDPKDGAIADTLWMRGEMNLTVFDFMDNILG